MSDNLPRPRQIAAILPCYQDYGDCTTVITATGIHLTLLKKVRTVIHQLARAQAIDLRALKQQTCAATGKIILQPLPLASGLLLVPLKVRQPRVNGDPCSGYVNFYAVTGVAANHCAPYQATLSLTGGATVNVLWTTRTVNKYLQAARLTLAAPKLDRFTAVHEIPASYEPQVALLARKLADVIQAMIGLRQLGQH